MSFPIAMIVVSYQKPELVTKFSRSIQLLEQSNKVFTVVVDNGASAESHETLSALVSNNCHVLFEKENWGYFGGAQKGLEYLNKIGINPEWVIISNSDIEFPQKDIWPRLLSYQAKNTLGVLAPSISSGLSDEDQNPFHVERPSSRRMHFYKWCFNWYLTGATHKMLGLMKSLAKKKRPKRRVTQSQKIYAPHGAFIIFHRHYLDHGYDFQHGAFLFNEEFTVAENCKRSGLDVMYEPSLLVRHEEHATMGNFPSRATIRFHREASRFTADHFFSEFDGK